jgi:hypothetical protein
VVGRCKTRLKACRCSTRQRQRPVISLAIQEVHMRICTTGPISFPALSVNYNLEAVHAHRGMSSSSLLLHATAAKPLVSSTRRNSFCCSSGIYSAANDVLLLAARLLGFLEFGAWCWATSSSQYGSACLHIVGCLPALLLLAGLVFSSTLHYFSFWAVP